jgi:hypothetical protein
MSGRRTILQSAMFTLVLLAATSAQSAPDPRANDACLAKPDATTPPGQHWYYRIDHANNKRQCWHLGPEGDRVQKSEPQEESQAAPDVAVQSSPTARVQPFAAASHSGAPPESSQDTAAIAPVPPVPWVDAPKMPQLPAFLQPTPQAPPAAAVRSASATPAAIGDEIHRENEPTLPVNPRQPTRTIRAASRAVELQKPAGARPSLPAITARSTTRSLAEVDHIFAFLMVVFAVLAVTGPALHYAERRRRREAINFQPPRWARVVALNAPAPRELVTLPPEPLVRSPAPVPVMPADQPERLAQALQQLVDRLQTKQAPEPTTVRVRSRELASG